LNAHATAVRRARPGIFGQLPDDAVARYSGGVRLAATVMFLPLGLLRSRIGRRLLAAAALALALTTAVGALYDNADVPAKAVGKLAALDGTAAPAAQAAPSRDNRQATANRPSREVGRRPEDAAASWFARRHGVDRDRVQALQQERVTDDQRRVLVMADAGDGRLPTGYVTVRRDGSGWAVG
jgi:hypothetical protein